MAEDDDIDAQQPVYEDDEPESGIFRWMSALVVLLAVAGFFGLAWYAYRNGGETVDEKDVEVVKADKTPVKEAPANPGGMQIPNQDKTVYGLISGKNEKPVVEHILPAPEQPLARASGNTETWMSDSLKSKIPVSTETVTMPAQDAGSGGSGGASAPAPQFAPAKLHDSAAPTPAAPVMANAVPAQLPAAASPNAASTKPLPAAVPVPAPKSSATVPVAPKAAAKPEDDADDSEESDEKTVAVKPQATPASAPPAGVRVQLGAYKSPGEAGSNWAKIARKFADDVQGKQHYVVRADLGSKGVYYRLQLAPFTSSSAAEQFCIDFVSAGQQCIVAKGK